MKRFVRHSGMSINDRVSHKGSQKKSIGDGNINEKMKALSERQLNRAIKNQAANYIKQFPDLLISSAKYLPGESITNTTNSMQKGKKSAIKMITKDIKSNKMQNFSDDNRYKSINKRRKISLEYSKAKPMSTVRKIVCNEKKQAEGTNLILTSLPAANERCFLKKASTAIIRKDNDHRIIKASNWGTQISKNNQQKDKNRLQTVWSDRVLEINREERSRMNDCECVKKDQLNQKWCFFNVHSTREAKKQTQKLSPAISNSPKINYMSNQLHGSIMKLKQNSALKSSEEIFRKRSNPQTKKQISQAVTLGTVASFNRSLSNSAQQISNINTLSKNQILIESLEGIPQGNCLLTSEQEEGKREDHSIRKEEPTGRDSGKAICKNIFKERKPFTTTSTLITKELELRRRTHEIPLLVVSGDSLETKTQIASCGKKYDIDAIHNDKDTDQNQKEIHDFGNIPRDDRSNEQKKQFTYLHGNNSKESSEIGKGRIRSCSHQFNEDHEIRPQLKRMNYLIVPTVNMIDSPYKDCNKSRIGTEVIDRLSCDYKRQRYKMRSVAIDEA